MERDQSLECSQAIAIGPGIERVECQSEVLGSVHCACLIWTEPLSVERTRAADVRRRGHWGETLGCGTAFGVSPSIFASPSLSMTARSRRTVSDTYWACCTARLPMLTSSYTTACFSSVTCSLVTGMLIVSLVSATSRPLSSSRSWSLRPLSTAHASLARFGHSAACLGCRGQGPLDGCTIELVIIKI
jgi:hypothetical protein